MSTLEEQIDINAPAGAVWEELHRVDDYPLFVDGVRNASTHGRRHAHLDVATGDGEQDFETEITDLGRGRVMAWRTLGGPDLKGAFALLELDPEHTRVQIRLEYDPDTVRETFGGPRGFAQAGAIERAVRADLELFKSVVEAQP
ncbi:SRPBCC family protein [Kitasatospora sp. NPDC050543]|uniref:SRPBCC family protein n=1 Tax=Kitasatospora sp. NPDC050543 TaxID=3364054 RepID=UPI0037B047CC